jgi:hypothetical protein
MYFAGRLLLTGEVGALRGREGSRERAQTLQMRIAHILCKWQTNAGLRRFAPIKDGMLGPVRS